MKYEFAKFEYYERENGKLIPADEKGRSIMMSDVINSVQENLDLFITTEDKKKPEHMRMTRQNVYDMVCNLTCNYDDGSCEQSIDRIFSLLTLLNNSLNKVIRITKMKEVDDENTMEDA